MRSIALDNNITSNQCYFLTLGLNDSEEMSLIDIMVCACKQASTRQGPPGRAGRKVKESKSIVNEKKDLSAHFMQTLPSLLNKVCKEMPLKKVKPCMLQ